MHSIKECVRRGLFLAVVSVATPLLFVGASAVVYNWLNPDSGFSLYSNALSDLGHAVKSNVASMFNLGLSSGGLLMVVFAVKYVATFSRQLSCIVSLIGYALVLVAVYDEVYGDLHFWVSVMLFTLVLFLVLACGLLLKSPILRLVASVLVLANIVLWALHLVMKIPPGAAIPELTSIFTATPFYMYLAKRSLERTCKVASFS